MTGATGPCGSCPCSGATTPLRCWGKSRSARRSTLPAMCACWASITWSRCRSAGSWLPSLEKWICRFYDGCSEHCVPHLPSLQFVKGRVIKLSFTIFRVYYVIFFLSVLEWAQNFHAGLNYCSIREPPTPLWTDFSLFRMREFEELFEACTSSFVLVILLEIVCHESTVPFESLFLFQHFILLPGAVIMQGVYVATQMEMRLSTVVSHERFISTRVSNHLRSVTNHLFWYLIHLYPYPSEKRYRSMIEFCLP